MALGHLISNGWGNSVFARPLYLANSKRTNNVNGGKRSRDSDEFCSRALQKSQILLRLANMYVSEGEYTRSSP